MEQKWRYNGHSIWKSRTPPHPNQNSCKENLSSCTLRWSLLGFGIKTYSNILRRWMEISWLPTVLLIVTSKQNSVFCFGVGMFHALISLDSVKPASSTWKQKIEGDTTVYCLYQHKIEQFKQCCWFFCLLPNPANKDIANFLYKHINTYSGLK